MIKTIMVEKEPGEGGRGMKLDEAIKKAKEIDGYVYRTWECWQTGGSLPHKIYIVYRGGLLVDRNRREYIPTVQEAHADDWEVAEIKKGDLLTELDARVAGAKSDVWSISDDIRRRTQTAYTVATVTSFVGMAISIVALMVTLLLK